VRLDSASGGNGAANGREGGVGIAAQRGNGADADHDDQGKHHRVLDGCRAVLTLEELDGKLHELIHDSVPFGSLAIRNKPEPQYGPMALRPHLEMGLPFRG